jgi:hypothetical protein
VVAAQYYLSGSWYPARFLEIIKVISASEGVGNGKKEIKK